MQFYGVWQTVFGVRGFNFTKLGQDIGRSSLRCTFVSEFGYIAAFSKAGGSNSSDFATDAKFRTFWPPVKIRGGAGISLDQLMKFYLRPNLWESGNIWWRGVGSTNNLDKKLIRRWDSERELSLRRHRTRTTKYNVLVHKFRHRSTRLSARTQVYQI